MISIRGFSEEEEEEEEDCSCCWPCGGGRTCWPSRRRRCPVGRQYCRYNVLRPFCDAALVVVVDIIACWGLMLSNFRCSNEE